MWKPRVLSVRPRPHLGGGAARFAAEIRGRFGPPSDSQLYPEAWLVFREQEEQEAGQAAGEIRLTQLTLRLALQLNEYFSSGSRETVREMEVHSLRQTLRTCLTALESRDRAICREIRLLVNLSRQGAGEEPSPRAQTREMEVVRERLVQRLAQLERTERLLVREGTEGRAAPVSPAPEGGMRLAPAADKTKAAPASAPRTVRLTPSPWRRAVLPTVGPMAPDGRRQAARRAQQAVEEHKERFLQLLRQTEPGEQEMVWRLATEHTQLTVRRREQWNETYHLDASEKLERLVRESSVQEYTNLLQVLRRQLSLPPDSLEEPVSEKMEAASGERTPDPQTERAENTAKNQRLTAQAAPLLDWLDRTLRQGRVRRTAMLAQLLAAPEQEQSAFLALAEASGVFHTPRRQQKSSGGEVPTSWERLTLLTRESRRQELEALVRWTKALGEPEAAPKPQLVSSSESAAPILPVQRAEEQSGRQESGQGSAEPVPQAQRRESAAGRELRQFLTLGRQEYRHTLVRLLEAAQPGEREGLLTGLLETVGTGASPAGERWETGGGGTILRLLERSTDPVRLLERVRAAQEMPAGVREPGRREAALEGRPASPGGERGIAGAPELRPLTGTADRTKKSALPPLPQTDLQHREFFREEASGQGGDQSRPMMSQPPAMSRREERPNAYRPLGEQAAFHEPLLDQVTRWAEDRRRWEKLELAKTAPSPLGEQGGTFPGVQPAFAAFGHSSGAGAGGPAPHLPPRPESEAALVERVGQRSPAGRQSPPDIRHAVPQAGQAPFRFPAREQAGERPGQRGPSPLVPRKEAQPTGQGAPGESTSTPEMPVPWRAEFPRMVGARREAQPPKTGASRNGVPAVWKMHSPGENIFPMSTPPFGAPDQTANPQSGFPLSHRTEGQTVAGEQTQHRETGAIQSSMARAVLRAAQGQGSPKRPVGRTEEAGFSSDHVPELELRWERAGESPNRTEQRAVEEQVTLAMERQAPQLNLLRRQSQEQERVLEEQKQDLNALKKRLERQESMVRRAVETARVPGAEEPAQVRRLAKAVMKELEGQLRLERQRRGLS